MQTIRSLLPLPDLLGNLFVSDRALREVLDPQDTSHRGFGSTILAMTGSTVFIKNLYAGCRRRATPLTDARSQPRTYQHMPTKFDRSFLHPDNHSTRISAPSNEHFVSQSSPTLETLNPNVKPDVHIAHRHHPVQIPKTAIPRSIACWMHFVRCTVTLLGITGASADDWPCWRGPQHTGAVNG